MQLGVWAGPGDDVVGLSVLRKAGSGQELHTCFYFILFFIHAEKGFKVVVMTILLRI